MKKGVFRSYHIERDAEGKPTQMIWNGDYERCAPLSYIVCQRCGSRRMKANVCLDCWWKPVVMDEHWRRV